MDYTCLTVEMPSNISRRNAFDGLLGIHVTHHWEQIIIEL